MKNTVMLLVASALLIGCSSTQVVRTPENDSMMRVIIDPRIEVEHYVQIRRALVQSGKFEVIDRREGFEAAVNEQDLQFRSGYQDRFSDREKWAHIGRMFGARGVITANAQCFQKVNWMGEYRKFCKQELAFIDAYTGRVEFAVRGENSEAWVVGYTVPDWDEVVERAANEYPKHFKVRKIDPLLEQYMDQSEERAKRERARGQDQTLRSIETVRSPQAVTTEEDVKADLQMMREAAIKMNKEMADGQ